LARGSCGACDAAGALLPCAPACCAKSAAARLRGSAAARAFRPAAPRIRADGVAARRAAEVNPTAFPEKKLNGRHLDLFSLYKQARVRAARARCRHAPREVALTLARAPRAVPGCR
jgi:hypothetical protein